MRKTPIITTSLVAALTFSVLMIYIFTSTILGSILTTALGTKTTINNTVISLNHLRFWQFQMLNMPNTKFPYALSIQKISIEAPLTTYLSNNVRIKEIEIEGIVLVVETLPGNGNVTNWDAIIAHMNAPVKKESKSTKDTTIDTLVLKNITINFVDPTGKVTVSKINELKFKNLSTKDGNITAQITKTILMKLILNANTLIKVPVKISKDSMNEFLKNTKFFQNGKINPNP